MVHHGLVAMVTVALVGPVCVDAGAPASPARLGRTLILV